MNERKYPSRINGDRFDPLPARPTKNLSISEMTELELIFAAIREVLPLDRIMIHWGENDVSSAVVIAEALGVKWRSYAEGFSVCLSIMTSCKHNYLYPRQLMKGHKWEKIKP